MSKSKNKYDFLEKDLRGKTIVFTGGTDGMGKTAVKKLAAMGATIFLLGRNKEKTIAVISELNEIAGKNNTHYIHCDLASQKSVREAAKAILVQCKTIDLLINCAGIQPGADRKVTIDGFELNWAVNHLGPFLLTNLLLNKIKESAPSRIVNLSSATEKNGHIHIDDLQLKDNWSMLKAYPQAKLAMNMCTRKMAKDLKGTGVAINALNPGFIKTNLLNNGLKGWGKIAGALYMYIAASKPEVGGDRILRLALSDEYEVVSGKFIYEDDIKDPNPEALDENIVEKVWAISKEHTGL